MGDTGSLFVGFVLSAITMRAAQLASADAFPLVPVLLLAVPLLDTLDAIRRRTIAAAAGAASPLEFLRHVRARVFAPDGMHLHHRLVLSGLSARRTVALMWAVAGCFALAACMVLHAPWVGMAFAAVIAVAVTRNLGAMEARLVRAPVVPRVLTLAAEPVDEAELGEPAEAASRAA
jgi:UDP-GlcNAc:undecaprenyl-phosphate GlcNAc-1-phosphate transferase